MNVYNISALILELETTEILTEFRRCTDEIVRQFKIKDDLWQSDYVLMSAEDSQCWLSVYVLLIIRFSLNSPDIKIGTRLTYCESLDQFLCAKVEIWLKTLEKIRVQILRKS